MHNPSMNMKSLVVTCFSLFIASFLFAQKPDVEVYEKKDGEKTLIIARNTGKVESSVKVSITSEGMDIVPSPVVEATVPPGYMKEMATITPRPGETWSYSYDVAITQPITKPAVKPVTPGTATSPASKPQTTATGQQTNTADPALSNAAIILYAKPGCGRCTYAKKQLTSLGIEFLEIDTHSSSPEVPNMWAQMRDQGFKSGSVTMPVIRVEGKYYYDI